jgi:hypothetical protein
MSGDIMPFLDGWVKVLKIPAPPKSEALRLHPQKKSPAILEKIKLELSSCYLDPWEFKDLLKSVGLERILDYLREKHFPVDEKTRKGNFGEMLALVWVRDALGYEVPLVKRRWAMNRQRSQHGEDVIGFIFSKNGTDKLILVEAKFYTKKVPEAIRIAHNTITKCLTATECYSLHAIASYFQTKKDRRRYKKVKSMFNDFAGLHFEKLGGIFIVTIPTSWDDKYFVKYIGSNGIENLKCWALVCDYITKLYEEAH